MLTPPARCVPRPGVHGAKAPVKLPARFSPGPERPARPRAPTMATIYRKTAKGQLEIETRALRLGPRLRGALILVDGRRSDVELVRLLPVQPEETLRALIEQGLIEAAAVAADAPPQRPTAAPAAPGPAPASMPPRAFEAMRADLVRSFTDLVGPMAEALAIKMERTRSPGELKPLLHVAQQIVANARGAQAAASFGARVERSIS